MQQIIRSALRTGSALAFTVSAALVSNHALADVYLGFGAGRASLDERVFGASTDFTGDDTSEDYFFGLKLGRDTRFEFGRVDLGLLEDTITIGGTPTLTTVGIDGNSYSFLFSEPLAEDFALYLRAGIFSWDREVSGPLATPRRSGSNGMFGIGGSLRISDDFSLRAEYQRYEVGHSNVDMPLLAIVYHF